MEKKKQRKRHNSTLNRGTRTTDTKRRKTFKRLKQRKRLNSTLNRGTRTTDTKRRKTFKRLKVIDGEKGLTALMCLEKPERRIEVEVEPKMREREVKGEKKKKEYKGIEKMRKREKET